MDDQNIDATDASKDMPSDDFLIPSAVSTSSEKEDSDHEEEDSDKPTSNADVTFEGNNYDLMSIISITIGGVMLISCVSCGMASYILPFAPIILGIIGLLTAKDAVDPERTKLLSWISLATGGAIILLMVLAIGGYLFFFFSMMMAAGANNGGF